MLQMKMTLDAYALNGELLGLFLFNGELGRLLAALTKSSKSRKLFPSGFFPGAGSEESRRFLAGGGAWR